MASLPLSYYGEDVLRAVAEPVRKVTAEIRKVIDQMFDTCAAESGIGLAAPQVGLSRRIIVCDLSHLDMEPFCLINPAIKRRYGPLETEAEGCLSVPGVFMDVTRCRDIVVEGRDLKGRLMRLEATELLSRCIQHEVDHLDGRLFVDWVEDREQLASEIEALQGRLAEIKLTGKREMPQGAFVG